MTVIATESLSKRFPRVTALDRLSVDIGPGVTGLVPLSETGVGPEQDLRKAFPVGSDVNVIVVESDPARRKVRLSVKAVAAAEEAAEVREYAGRERAETEHGLGSLADKLRDALGRRS